MAYYYINTNANDSGSDKYKVWLTYHLAFAGGHKRYGEKFKKFKPDDICFMHVAGEGIRAVGKVLELWDGKAYREELMVSELGQTEYRLKVKWCINLRQPISRCEHNKIVGWSPQATVRHTVQLIRDHKVAEKLLRIMQQYADSEMSLPEEVNEPNQYFEGATSRIEINAYERDRQARDACIKHYGTCCFICGFSFGATYGKEFEEYIHVHHLCPLSEIGEEYRVDPVKDLRPVCPNCHAVIHLGRPPYKPEKVKNFIKNHEKHS